MNVLEKILEEMKKIKDGNRKEKLYAKYPAKNKRQEILNIYSQGYEDGTDNFYNAMDSFIRSNMNEVGEKIRKIADHYGWEEQHRNAIEEMAELTKAICKRERKYHGSFKSESATCPERTEIIGEIADVKIMLAQMEYLLSAEDEVQMIINQKVERQLERMRHECT